MLEAAPSAGGAPAPGRRPPPAAGRAPRAWGCPERADGGGEPGAGSREQGAAPSSRAAVGVRVSQRRRGAPALLAPLLRFPSLFLAGCEEARAAQGSWQTSRPRAEGGARGSLPPSSLAGRAEGKRRLGGRLQLALGALAISLCQIVALWKIISFLSALLQFLGQKYELFFLTLLSVFFFVI